MRRLGFSAGGACALVLLWIGACSSSSESSSPKQDAGMGGAGGATFGSSLCGQCIQTTCGAERGQCGAEPACAQYLTCIEGCGVTAAGQIDPACESGCTPPPDSAAKAAYDAFAACRAAAPCPACGTTDAGQDSGNALIDKILSQECTPSTATNKCLNCVESYCCHTEDACKTTAGCVEISECEQGCTTFACLKDCFAKSPNAVQAFLEEDACPLSKCGHPEGCLPDPEPATLCDTQNCVELRVKCLTNLDCYLHFKCDVDCYNNNPGQACYDACDAAAPAAALELHDAWDTCWLAKCS